MTFQRLRNLDCALGRGLGTLRSPGFSLLARPSRTIILMRVSPQGCRRAAYDLLRGCRIAPFEPSPRRTKACCRVAVSGTSSAGNHFRALVPTMSAGIYSIHDRGSVAVSHFRLISDLGFEHVIGEHFSA